MDTDNRRHPRFNPAGLIADITIEPNSLEKKLTLKGTVIDMSYSGIKIKLNTPISNDIPESEILINITMPESGVPITIHGIIKHYTKHSECGFQYTKSKEQNVDNLMFECIKTASPTIQRNNQEIPKEQFR